MEAFHKIKIKCPYEILEIEEIKIKNKPNEHGYLYFKAIVDDSVNFKYAIEASTEDKICIYEETENEEESVIFYGTIQNISTNNNIDGIYHIEIEAYTSSFDLDIEEKSRSFQDIEMSYDDFLNIIMTDFQMYDYTQCMKKPESIGFPRFQYKESSYRMIVRTASYLGINVYCDIINPSNAFFFGKPSGREYELEDDIDYTATLDINKYRESLVHNPDSHPTDFFYYEIKTPKVMHIGYNVTFKQKKFYIYSYEAEYVRGELIYTYRLCREKGIWQDKIYNDKLKGISLEGKVLEVSGEQVKLHLNIDENQDQAKAAWFRYAPPTGNIMYSMPIVGTSANLYFPNERNEEPIVIGCVRKNGSSCEMFSDVNNRYFSTESGNNLDLLPDAINFSRPGLSANFNDGSGITLKSSSSLSINAGYVGMFAGNISITGTEKLVAEKGSSIISLENDFYNSAGIIKENGSDRASNPKFTDDEPTNGAMEAKAAMEMMMNASALAAANDGSIGTIVDLRDTLNKPWANTDSIGNSDKPEEITSLGDVFNRTGNAFKEIGSDFYKGLDERRKKALDSPYDFVNYLTLGLPDTVKGMLNNNQKNGEKMLKSGSAYDIGNWATMGSFDMIKGTFNPEEPLSKEHWTNSFGVVSMLFGMKQLKNTPNEFIESNNLKPGVKLTNQSESSVSGEIEDLIKESKDFSNYAHNAAQYDKLKTYYRQAKKYGTGSIKELPDGRFRFYEEVKPASTKGEMAGARHVREWNPQSGAKRDWYETVDHLGNIRQVRPSPYITGGIKVHYMFDIDGNYIGCWSPKK